MSQRESAREREKGKVYKYIITSFVKYLFVILVV